MPLLQLPDFPAKLAGLRGLKALQPQYVAGYLVIGLAWLLLEGKAIDSPLPGDTFTEFIRSIIFIHPVVWLPTLGLYLGFQAWLIRHFWWRRK